MKPATNAMKALLDSVHGTDGQLIAADLVTFILVDGTTFLITSYDTGNVPGHDLTVYYPSFPGDVRTGTATFSSDVSLYPQPDKESGIEIKWAIGTDVSTITMNLDASDGNVIDALPILQAFVQGRMDGAAVYIERMYLLPVNADTLWSSGGTYPTGALVNFQTNTYMSLVDSNTGNMPDPAGTSYWQPVGTVPLFYGGVSDIAEIGNDHVQFALKDRRELLNVPIPYNVYMAGCQWGLYSAGCRLIKANFAVLASVAAPTIIGPTTLPQNQQINVNILSAGSYPTNFFDQGIAVFTSGANEGAEASVRYYASGSPNVLTLYAPLLYNTAELDTITLYQGCAKTVANCKAFASTDARVPGATYAIGDRVTDGTNTQYCIVPGTADAGSITWNPAGIGSTTADGATVVWLNTGIGNELNFSGEPYIPVAETMV